MMREAILAGERIAPRHFALDEAQWERMVHAWAPLWFLAHWCDAGRAYALFLDGDQPVMASTPMVEGRYLALSKTVPAAAWSERMAQDLWDARPMFARDVRSLLDMGGWVHSAPLSSRRAPGSPPRACCPEDEPFGDATGPVVLTDRDMTFGLSHRGLVQRMLGLSPGEGLRHVGRISSGGFVAHALAYCRAVEAAIGGSVPPEGRDGRIVLSEIERISVHLGDLARVATLADAGLLATHATLARETIADLCVRHGATRRLTDVIAPEGIAPGIEVRELADAVMELVRTRLPDWHLLHEGAAFRLRHVGVLEAAKVTSMAIGGLSARATGRSFDLRQREDDPRYGAGRAGSLTEGDALARGRLRLREIRDSVRRLERVTSDFGASWEDGRQRVNVGEGIGAVEGARGDVWCWVRLVDDRIDGFHLRDGAFSLAPVLGRLVGGADAELVLASFGFSAASAAG